MPRSDGKDVPEVKRVKNRRSSRLERHKCHRVGAILGWKEDRAAEVHVDPDSIGDRRSLSALTFVRDAETETSERGISEEDGVQNAPRRPEMVWPKPPKPLQTQRFTLG